MPNLISSSLVSQSQYKWLAQSLVGTASKAPPAAPAAPLVSWLTGSSECQLPGRPAVPGAASAASADPAGGAVKEPATGDEQPAPKEWRCVDCCEPQKKSEILIDLPDESLDWQESLNLKCMA